MASDIWLRTILIGERKPAAATYATLPISSKGSFIWPSHKQDGTYHGLCYTSRGAMVGTRNSSMGSPHEWSIRRPIAPWACALTTELHLAPPAASWPWYAWVHNGGGHTLQTTHKTSTTTNKNQQIHNGGWHSWCQISSCCFVITIS